MQCCFWRDTGPGLDDRDCNTVVTQVATSTTLLGRDSKTIQFSPPWPRHKIQLKMLPKTRGGDMKTSTSVASLQTLLLLLLAAAPSMAADSTFCVTLLQRGLIYDDETLMSSRIQWETVYSAICTESEEHFGAGGAIVLAGIPISANVFHDLKNKICSAKIYQQYFDEELFHQI